MQCNNYSSSAELLNVLGSGSSVMQADDLRYLRWQGCDLDFTLSVIECSDQPADKVSTGQGVILGAVIRQQASKAVG